VGHAHSWPSRARSQPLQCDRVVGLIRWAQEPILGSREKEGTLGNHVFDYYPIRDAVGLRIVLHSNSSTQYCAMGRILDTDEGGSARDYQDWYDSAVTVTAGEVTASVGA